MIRAVRLPLLLLSLLAGCGQVPGSLTSSALTLPLMGDDDKDTAAPAPALGDDVVVIAVIDSNINPYHWDYLAAKMPGDALPLEQDPATWLPGHPGASVFKSYEALPLTLDANNAEASTSNLHDKDLAEWSKIQYSEGNTNADVHYYWFPGTKIVGHIAFGGSGAIDTWAASSHGIGTSSVSAGNIHGTCPHCVIVYVHGTEEQANQWVSQQDWIDLQSNSFGHSLIGGPVRDLVYAQSDTDLQRRTVERGQSIFFSAGNGLANDFSAPQINLVSSEKGPDWIITVGAIEPASSGSFSGHGKPADVSSLGDQYPSAYGDADTTTNEGGFGGTSNATPVVAGIYGESLYRIRKAIGSKRVQKDGVIAEGSAGCGAANANCALADGKLTVHELREALFRAARYTEAGTVVGSSLVGEYLEIPGTSNVKELEFLSEGHGSYYGRFKGEDTYEEEIARVVGYAHGDWYEEQDADQRDWMVADSICRQGGWGEWAYGYSPLFSAPAPSPEWPVRTWMTEVCPSLLGGLVQAEKLAPPLL